MSDTERSDSADALSLGIRLGPVRPSRTGAEMGVAVYGGVLGHAATGVGWAGAALDLDVAHVASLGEESGWSMRAGTSLFGGAGEGGGVTAGGFNAGLGIGSAPASGVGFRADVLYRLLFERGGSLGLVSVSVGLVWPGKDAGAARE